MKRLVQRIVRSFVSLIMTFVLMAAPVAAIVYFSDSTSKQVTISSAQADYNSWWRPQTAETVRLNRHSPDGEFVATLKIPIAKAAE